MTHTPHPDTHTHGLCDECPRCAEYVENPTTLDAKNMRRLWRGEIHTTRDMDAYNVLYRAAVLAQRITEAFQYEAWEDIPLDHMGSQEKPPAPALFDVGGRR